MTWRDLSDDELHARLMAASEHPFANLVDVLVRHRDEDDTGECIDRILDGDLIPE